MTDQRIDGVASTLEGKTQSGLGKLTGDSKLQLDGKFNEVKGKALDAYGRVIDGLDGLETIDICTAYTLRGETIHYPPSTIEDIEACVPVYETHQGWKQDLSQIKNFADLPDLAKAYLKRLEELTGARISLLGIGPSRDQTLVA